MPISSLKELRNNLGITQGDLAMEAGVSRHSVMRQEQLCYPHPLPNIIAALSDITGTAEEVLVKQYEHDVVLNRAFARVTYFYDHQILWRAFMKALSVNLNGHHPFAVWRGAVMEALGENGSQIHFCTVTSIHPATLSRYESFKTGFPTPVEVALIESGVPSDLVERFRTEGAFNNVID